MFAKQTRLSLSASPSRCLVKGEHGLVSMRDRRAEGIREAAAVRQAADRARKSAGLDLARLSLARTVRGSERHDAATRAHEPMRDGRGGARPFAGPTFATQSLWNLLCDAATFIRHFGHQSDGPQGQPAISGIEAVTRNTASARMWRHKVLISLSVHALAMTRGGRTSAAGFAVGSDVARVGHDRCRSPQET